MYRRLIGSITVSRNLSSLTNHATARKSIPNGFIVRCMGSQYSEEAEKQHKREFRNVLAVCAGATFFTIIALRYGWKHYRKWGDDFKEEENISVVPSQYAVEKAKQVKKDEKEITPESSKTETKQDKTEKKSDSPVSQETEAQQEEKEPELPEIPTHIKYLLIGGGTASVGAYRAIKAKDAKAQVLVVGEEPHVPYFRPPLSKELWFNDERDIAREFIFKDWNDRKKSVFYEPPPYYIEPKVLPTLENGGVGLVSGRKVIKLNPHKKRVWLDNGTEITYDKCLIATGGKPRNLPVIANADKEVQDRTILFRTLADYIKLDDAVQKSKSIAVIGGGFLGSELACALGYRGKDTGLKVYQIFPESGNLGSVLPEYLSKWTASKVQSVGVDVIPKNLVKSVKYADGQVQLTLSDGSTLAVDHIVVSVGLEPNVELAKTSGLEVDDKHGGFRVNAELEARTDVWIAGDAACFYDIKLGRRRVEHHDHAMVSGRLAGENMTGAAKPYWHQSTFWSDLGPHIGFEAIGLIDSSLETVAVFDRVTEQALKDEADQASKQKAAKTENVTVTEKEKIKPELITPKGDEEFGKGVLFYLKDKVIVGILMWNLMGKMSVARKVLRDGGENEDIYEVAKLFKIHES